MEHVLGIHFDFDLNKYGHPVFHSQLKSFESFAACIFQNFDLDLKVDNYVLRLPKRVRVPTAQMDVLSFILQVCADHMVSTSNQSSTLGLFNELLITSEVLIGAGHRAERLACDAAARCYRSLHWYPLIEH